MMKQPLILNLTVASLCVTLSFVSPAPAQDQARLDDFYAQLQEAEPKEAIRIAREIERELANSGSPAMNLLLKRGTDAMEAGDSAQALEHFTALTDHAPDFAEGWHRRAVVYAEMEMFGPAVADLERVLALEPRHYDAIASLGAILAKINEYEAAKEAFDQVLAIHPHHAEVSQAMGHVERQIGGLDL
jgi:tetratricopeptide (TPR) repeat protein